MSHKKRIDRTAASVLTVPEATGPRRPVRRRVRAYMHPGSERNFWIGVVSRSHVQVGVKGGFVQLGHGKKAPLQKFRPGDSLIMYSPRTAYPDGESRAIAQQLEVVPDGESSADAADRIAYGILVTALEEGLVNTIRHALDVLKRFRARAGILGEQWLSEQEGRLGKREWSSPWSEIVGGS